jgi:hypothetical protein
MEKLWVQLVYDVPPKPLPVAVTIDRKLAVLVKRQALKEARERLDLVKDADDVLRVEFGGELRKLEDTLNLLIPPELEELILSRNGDRDELESPE